jgi:hypothetical protein
MASFVWMLLTEPSYKPNTLVARSLAGEESKPEDSLRLSRPTSPAGAPKRTISGEVVDAGGIDAHLHTGSAESVS